MAARNSPEGFGWVTRSLHWVIAAGVLAMGILGSYIAAMEVSLANLWLFGLHKSLGLNLMILALIRIGWHIVSPPPAPLDDGIAWHGSLAKLVHKVLYLLLLAVPLCGWVASAATGLDVVYFATWTLPQIVPTSEPLEAVGFALHWGLTKLLFALVVLHITGALLRRDGTLRRMIFGGTGTRNAGGKDAQ